MRKRLWHAAVMRSGILTILVLATVLLGLAFGWREHKLGQFGQLKRQLGPKPEAQEPPSLKPGGQDVVQLGRSQLPGGNGPEFLGATLLPGRGMNVLQITAYVPQKGEISLLASPSVEEASRLMTGTGSDADGGESLKIGGAIEAPWAGRIGGTVSANGDSLTTVWHGRRLTLPVIGPDSSANGGLLLKQESVIATTNVMPDGGEAQASFHGDFNGRWISQTDLTSTLELSSRAIEMTVLAHNVGTEAEPIGIGWRPRFAISSEDRARATLRLPIGDHAEVADRRIGLPSGKLTPVTGTEFDFTAHDGVRLGSRSLDDSFVHLKPSFMDSGPVVELRDPASGYGLRITLETSHVKAIHIYAPANANYVSIDPKFNYDDPFGREWSKEEDTGMVILQPGQSVQWKIRLEIFSLTGNSSQHL